MPTFTDNQNRNWPIELGTTDIKRVRAATGVDLLSIAGGELLPKLSADTILLIDVIYVAIRPALDKANVTDEDFGRSLRGDALADATKALLEAVIDFFPSRQQTTLRKLLAKGRELQTLAADLADSKIDKMDLERILSTLGDSSTDLPVSSASTPDPSPSAS
jgi:hypothetical protein